VKQLGKKPQAFGGQNAIFGASRSDKNMKIIEDPEDPWGRRRIL